MYSKKKKKGIKITPAPSPNIEGILPAYCMGQKNSEAPELWAAIFQPQGPTIHKESIDRK